MKTILTLFAIIALINISHAQERKLDRVADSIQNEAMLLYKSEFASWYGTDLFLAKFPNLRPQIGGYISYENDKGGENNVFFSKGDAPEVFATTTFYNDFDKGHYSMDTTHRKLTGQEKELFTIRRAVVQQMEQRDTFYKTYNHTNLNPIPIIHNGKKQVYVLTGPDISGVVVFGNDYLIDFDANNNITNRRILHKNIIPVYYKKEATDSTKTDIGTAMHSHLASTGPYITATDICTLLLYEKLAGWHQHYVISKDDVSIWDCDKNQLVIITMEAWKKIAEDQHQRHPDKH